MVSRMSELHEIAFRLRELSPDQYCMNDEQNMAEAWLEDHPRDEDDPVTAEWLLRCGFYRSGRGAVATDGDAGVSVICILPSGSYRGEWQLEAQGTNISLPRDFPRRRDVRLLCTALGICLSD